MFYRRDQQAHARLPIAAETGSLKIAAARVFEVLACSNEPAAITSGIVGPIAIPENPRTLLPSGLHGYSSL